MKKYAIIVAGGKGERMQASLPKQFLTIGGKPVLRLTMERFLEYDSSIEFIVVLPSAYKEYWKNYCTESGFRCKFTMVSGGITRFHSVQNALKFIKESGLVAVHDGVRPALSVALIDRAFAAAQEKDAVIPVVPVVDSIRKISSDGDSVPVDRSSYVAVQTPQVFRSELLMDAYKKAYSPSFTDDASVVEAAGYKISLIEGEKANIKITVPEDLKSVSSALGF